MALSKPTFSYDGIIKIVNGEVIIDKRTTLDIGEETQLIIDVPENSNADFAALIGKYNGVKYCFYSNDVPPGGVEIHQNVKLWETDINTGVSIKNGGNIIFSAYTGTGSPENPTSTAYATNTITLYVNPAPQSEKPSFIETTGAIRGDTIFVSWASVTNVTNYMLQRSVNEGAFQTVYTGRATSFTETVQDEWETLQYRVLAIVNGVYSDWTVSLAQPVIDASQPEEIDNARLEQLQNRNGTNIYPKTIVEGVFRQSDGKTLAELLTGSGSGSGGVGQSMAGQTVEPAQGETVVAGVGAEIFNDYRERKFFSDNGQANTGNVATGEYSHAEGTGTTASNIRAHAEGRSTVASGIDSHAEGNRSVASGDFSHAEGLDSIAAADSSHAEGYDSKAYGACSHAEGSHCITSDIYSSVKIKSYNISSKTITFDELYYMTGFEAGTTCYIVLENNDSIYRFKTKITNVNDHTITLENLPNNIVNIFAAIPGYPYTGSVAYGGSHAEGDDSVALYNGAHSGGTGSLASGACSFAHGDKAMALEKNSFAIGRYAISRSNSQFVVGPCNLESKSNADRFIIGKGESKNLRSNCFRVTNTGVYASGNYNASGADYAEMFEWEDGNPIAEDRSGRFVTLDGAKIRFAGPNDDYILGIVSGNPSVVGDVHDDQWQGMYLYDIFGRPLWEDVEVPEETDKERRVIRPAHTEHRQKLNPAYNNSLPYQKRTERPEWDAVGMLGKLVAVDDGSCEVNGWCMPGAGGIAVKSEIRTKYRVMERLDENHIRVMIL